MARGVLVIVYFFQYVDKRPGPVALVLLRFVKKQAGKNLGVDCRMNKGVCKYDRLTFQVVRMGLKTLTTLLCCFLNMRM